MNNIADLMTVKLDTHEILLAEWEKQLLLFDKNSLEDGGNIIKFDNFSLYFQRLLNEVTSHIRFPYQCFVIQYHDYENHNNKLSYVGHMHVDLNRKSVITIPIISDEPICFYNDTDLSDNHSVISPDNLNLLVTYKKPTKVHRYSKNYPSLVNVRNTHSLFVADITLPRILIQINYDFTFNEIINEHPAIFKIYE